MSFTSQIKEFALDIGYSKAGVIPADSFPEYIANLTERQDMYSFYIHSPRKPLRAADPRSLIPGAKSIIMTVYDYAQNSFPPELTRIIGRIYQARCYDAPPERINGARPQLLRNFLQKLGCEVDDSLALPLRLAAAKAGIVNYGRNTFAYADGVGSFVYLNAFIVDKELEYDSPTVEVGCPGGCTACMKACPTQAIYKPLKLDPRRCIAFNTFFRQDHIAGSYIEPEYREKMGTRLHGCDICQEVCPRNQARLKANPPGDAFLENMAQEINLVKVLNMDEEFHQTRIQSMMHNYVKEKKYFQRNAAIALGNQGAPDTIPALAQAMEDPESVVRGYAAWALGKIGGRQATQILEKFHGSETDEFVRQEIFNALLFAG